MQGVESVEKSLLGAVFSTKKLNVIDEKHIKRAVPGLELRRAPLADGGGELVGELLAGDVANTMARREGLVANGMEKMSLTQTHGPVKKQRIVGAARRFGDSGCCGEGEPVAFAHHEGIECVASIQHHWGWRDLARSTR